MVYSICLCRPSRDPTPRPADSRRVLLFSLSNIVNAHSLLFLSNINAKHQDPRSSLWVCFSSFVMRSTMRRPCAILFSELFRSYSDCAAAQILHKFGRILNKSSKNPVNRDFFENILDQHVRLFSPFFAGCLLFPAFCCYRLFRRARGRILRTTTPTRRGDLWRFAAIPFFSVLFRLIRFDTFCPASTENYILPPSNSTRIAPT